MKKNLLAIFGIIILILIVWGGNWAWKNFRGAGPAVRDPNEDITNILPNSNDPNLPEAVNNTSFPLKLPKGFVISVFAKNLLGARVLAQDGFGNLWVSQTGQGTISQLEIKDGQVVRQNAVFKNLDRPHGLAIANNVLYFAEETKITRVTLYSDDPGKKIADLPKGGRHFTRTLGFGPDGRLYVSIGSTCDVCNEKDSLYAAIYSMKEDGSDFKQVASGLRNSVFFRWSEVDGRMWGTEMGRDHLGDNLPPDEINIIEGPSTGSGQNSIPNFGWPICYGKNIHDIDFDPEGVATRPYGASNNPCEGREPSYIDLPAHSAPLGLAFIPESTAWPEDYWHNLIVAFHGSWNRSEPTGYKLMRIKLDAKGNYQGMEDFISGWLAKDGKMALGRPVDVLEQPGGSIYVSDDKAGVIYKVSFMNPSSAADKTNLIRVSKPQANQIVKSPLAVEGEARGTWYFEASFPVKLFDEKGRELAVGIAQVNPPAGGEWMTENFVPFKIELKFSPPATDSGYLVLQKDNPSGLPEYEDELRIPLKFK